MGTYIFLTNSVVNMGGSEMLIRNRVLDLEKRGWNVEVFHFCTGEILIPELKRYENNLIPELKHPVYSFSLYKRNQIVKMILNKVNIDKTHDKTVIVESTKYSLGYWGELLAKEVNGLSLLYFISEFQPKVSLQEEKFLIYKQSRGEFLNHPTIKQRYSERIYNGHQDEYMFKLPSYNNVLTDQPFIFEYNKNYPVITSIARLEKPYILPMVDEIIKFAELNNQSINLFFIGGACRESYIQEIKNRLVSTTKIIPYFWGYQYPIPKNLLSVSDVVIATSGSSEVSYSLNLTTISMSVDDHMPLGIFGITTFSRLYRNGEPKIPLSNLLKDVIIDKKYKSGFETMHTDLQFSDSIYDENMQVLEKLINNKREFYNVSSIFNLYDRVKYWGRIFLKTMIGNDNIIRLRRLR